LGGRGEGRQERHAPVRLPTDLDPDDLDERADDTLAQLAPDQQRAVERSVRMLEEVVGAPERLRRLAADIVAHWGLGTSVLAVIARELVRSIRRDVTVDWTVREQARARLRSNVKRLLARHGYPPDAEQDAITLVLQQTETFAERWAA